MGLSKLAEEFDADPDNFDFSKLEKESNFVENYKGIEQFLADKQKVYADLYNNFEGKKISEARFDKLKEDYPWINREELDQWFDKTNQYKKEYELEREREAGIIRRTAEVNEWSVPKRLLTTDYEKQRYIYEPESATFGKEAGGLGSSMASKGDIITSVLGTVADAVPTPAFTQYWLGPAIRTGRDIAYNVSNSPYAKEWPNIAKDAGIDIGSNVGAEVYRNWRKGQKLQKSLLSNDPQIQKFIKAQDEKDAIQEGTKMFREFQKANKGAANPAELRQLVESMPESEMKNKLMGLTSDLSNIDGKEITSTIADFTSQTAKNVQDQAKKVASGELKVVETKVPTSMNTNYMQTVLTAPEQLTKKQKALLLGNKTFNWAKDNLSTPITKFTGRQTSTLGNIKQDKSVAEKFMEQPEQQATIDRIINNYSLLWSKTKKPLGYDDSPIIKAAWEKWRKE